MAPSLYSLEAWRLSIMAHFTQVWTMHMCGQTIARLGLRVTYGCHQMLVKCYHQLRVFSPVTIAFCDASPCRDAAFQTNMLGEDDASWQPMTKRRLAAEAPRDGTLARTLAWLRCSTPLKLLGSLAHWVASFGGLDLKRYYAPMRWNMVASWAVPFWFVGLAFPAIIAAGGISGMGDLRCGGSQVWGISG